MYLISINSCVFSFFFSSFLQTLIILFIGLFIFYSQINVVRYIQDTYYVEENTTSVNGGVNKAPRRNKALKMEDDVVAETPPNIIFILVDDMVCFIDDFRTMLWIYAWTFIWSYKQHGWHFDENLTTFQTRHLRQCNQIHRREIYLVKLWKSRH